MSADKNDGRSTKPIVFCTEGLQQQRRVALALLDRGRERSPSLHPQIDGVLFQMSAFPVRVPSLSWVNETAISVQVRPDNTQKRTTKRGRPKEDDQKPFSYRSVLQLQLRLCPAVGRFRRKHLDRCHVAAHRRQVQRGAACEKRTIISCFE